MTPKWLICTVTIESDVMPAQMEGRRYADWPRVVEWVTGQVGAAVQLTPVSAVVWQVREAGTAAAGRTDGTGPGRDTP